MSINRVREKGSVLEGEVFPAPLSFAQERLWFLDRYEPNSALYVIPEARLLRGELDLVALEKALNQLVARHEMLRTIYSDGQIHPVQTVVLDAEVRLAQFDLTSLGYEEREKEAQRVLKKLAKQPIDLGSDLMLRPALLLLSPDEHILLLSIHHIAADGWSISILFRELGELYSALVTGRVPDLPDMTTPYTDFALWQREELTGDLLDRQASYWKQRLAGSPTLLDLPLDHPRPAVQDFAGSTMGVDLGPDLSEQVRQFARYHKLTLYTVLLGAFQVLLHRLSDQDDFLVGTPIAGRNQPQFENLVGLFVNTLARRADFSQGESFADLLRRSQRDSFEAYGYQDLPFEKLFELLQVERNLSHSPLVQVMFTFHNTPGLHAEFHDLTVTRLVVPTDTAKFDLLLSLSDKYSTIRGELEYASDLFEESTIQRFIGQYRTLLAAALRNPDQRTSEIPLLSDTDRHQLLVEWNDTGESYPFNGLHRQVEDQAAARGAAIALEQGARRLTYSELVLQADRVAANLQNFDLGGSPVGVLLERSIDSVVATLAILRTGAAYLPLDRSLPPTLLAFMIQDARVQVLITDKDTARVLPTLPCRVLDIGSLPDSDLAPPPPREVSPHDALYVIYTSGSTGQPKGVEMPHGPLVNLLAWQTRQLQDKQENRVAHMTPLSFDVSCQEVFSTLTSGGTLVIVPDTIRRDPVALWRFLRDEEITRLFLPFVALEQLAELAGATEGVKLTTVICAGEQLKITPAIRRLFERLPGCSLINHYGPTETHVVTAFELTGPPARWPELPPIGRPIANTQVYVLDRNREPVPIGVRGELYIGGDCLSRGYLHRPKLTAERFVENPISGAKSTTLYRTGDLVRVHRDGNLEFLGRDDGQVKVRGYRVELGEIEATLVSHPRVSSMAVDVRADSALQRLVAYVVPADDPAGLVVDLKELAMQRLPEYMLPSRYLLLNELPLTRSGKVDRQALPDPESIDESLESSFVAPRSAVEKGLATIWQGLLKVEPIGIRHNFFDLGGHSLLATRMVAHIEKRFGVSLPLIELFRTPTIEDLAVLIAKPTAATGNLGIVPFQPGGTLPPFLMVSPLPIFRPLARHLGTDQPFLSLVVPPLSSLPAGYTILDLVEPMLEEVLANLQEPYCLGGWCRYGLIAYELARQLRARGRQVSLLALFDTYSPAEIHDMSSRDLRKMRSGLLGYEIRYHLRCLQQLNSAEKRAYLSERAGKVLTYLRSSFSSTPSSPGTNGDKSFFKELHLDLSNYSPGTYDGRVVLFKAAEAWWTPPGDPTWGWGSLVESQIEQHSVPGNHLTMFGGNNVADLGAKLSKSLTEAYSTL